MCISLVGFRYLSSQVYELVQVLQDAGGVLSLQLSTECSNLFFNTYTSSTIPPNTPYIYSQHNNDTSTHHKIFRLLMAHHLNSNLVGTVRPGHKSNIDKILDFGFLSSSMAAIDTPVNIILRTVSACCFCYRQVPF